MKLRLIPILPVEKGGTRITSNFAIVCRECEEAIFDATNDEFPSQKYPSDWKQRNGYIRELDEFKCVCCRKDVSPESPHQEIVHHIRPLARDGKNRLTNLATVCKQCSDKIHKEGTQANINVGAATNAVRQFAETMLEVHKTLQTDPDRKAITDCQENLQILNNRLMNSPIPEPAMKPCREMIRSSHRELKFREEKLQYSPKMEQKTARLKRWNEIAQKYRE